MFYSIVSFNKYLGHREEGQQLASGSQHIIVNSPVFRANLILLFVSGLQKQMLFMRCAYESQLDHLTIFPFPGLKIVNIRGIKYAKINDFLPFHWSKNILGNALLTLDLIIINHFVSRLQSDNQLLELSLRDQVSCTNMSEQFY